MEKFSDKDSDKNFQIKKFSDNVFFQIKFLSDNGKIPQKLSFLPVS